MEKEKKVNLERRRVIEITGITIAGFFGGMITDRTGNALYAEEPAPIPKQTPKPDPMFEREKEILHRASIIFPDSLIIPQDYKNSFLELIYAAHIAAGRDPDFPLEYTIAQIDKESRSRRTGWKHWDQYAVSSQLALGPAQFIRKTAEGHGAKTYTRQDSKELWNLEQKINNKNKELRNTLYTKLENERNTLVDKFQRILLSELKGEKNLSAFDWRLAPEKAFALNALENRINITKFAEQNGGESYLNAQGAIIAYNIGIYEALRCSGIPKVEETIDYYNGIMNNAGLLIGPKGKLYAQKISSQGNPKT